MINNMLFTDLDFNYYYCGYNYTFKFFTENIYFFYLFQS
jgi:hypothetical protein